MITLVHTSILYTLHICIYYRNASSPLFIRVYCILFIYGYIIGMYDNPCSYEYTEYSTVYIYVYMIGMYDNPCSYEYIVYSTYVYYRNV